MNGTKKRSAASDTQTPKEAAEATVKVEDRACPTRIDGAIPLIQGRVTPSQCQAKQRRMYHKCFTCAHANRAD